MARRSAVDAAATRNAILAAAHDLFTEQGFADTTSREIAARAGVTVGAVFHHFGTKAKLFEAVLRSLIAELNQTAVAVVMQTEAKEPLDAVLAGLRVALSFAGRPDFHRIVTVDGPGVIGVDAWREIDSQLGLRTVAGGVKRLKALGLIADIPTRALAVLILGAMSNAGFALARSEPDVDLDRLMLAFHHLFEGLAPRPVAPDTAQRQPAAP